MSLLNFKVEKMQSKLKANKRLIDDNEEEVTQLKNRNRKLVRDIEELTEQNESLTKDLNSLRQKQRYVLLSLIKNHSSQITNLIFVSFFSILIS